MMDIDYLHKFTSEELEILKNNTAYFYEQLFHALEFSDDLEQSKEEFLSTLLPKPMLKEYSDETEFVEVQNIGRKNAARISLIKSVRDLQDKKLITDFHWSYPPKEIAFEKEKQVRTGLLKLLYSNGEVALSGHLQKTLRMGEWLHFYENGEMMARGSYTSGEKVGIWKHYYENGLPKSKGEYKENLKEGKWSFWDENQKLTTAMMERGRKTDKKLAA